MTGDREYVYSLTLPQLGESKWEPPADVRRGIPRALPVPSTVRDLWPWLALAGGLGLLAEWFLYGRFRRTQVRRNIVLSRETLADVKVARR